MACATIHGKPVGVAYVVHQSSSAEPNQNDKLRSASSIRHCQKCSYVMKSAEQYISHCPYFFGSISSSNASKLIRTQPVGTFLLRNSSDRRYPYALTVQTSRGPKSIRVTQTSGGAVQLDCDETQKTAVRRFDNIFHLIQYHVRISSAASAMQLDGTRKSKYSFTDRNGTADSSLVLNRSLDVALSRRPQTLAKLCLEQLTLLRMDSKIKHHAHSSRTSRGCSSSATVAAAECVNCYVDSLLARGNGCHDDRLRSLLMNHPFGF